MSCPGPGRLQLWSVIGGCRQAGILVRAGADLASPTLPERLSTGALVEELELIGDRLHFHRVTGRGPERGWASITCAGRDLLIRTEAKAADMAANLGSDWNLLDRTIFSQSKGKCHPRVLAMKRRAIDKGGVQGRVSVVTPTTGVRAPFHERLWACFQAQTWPDKELVVVETCCDALASPFLAEQARSHEEVVHVSLQGNFSIGLKRNIGILLASGATVVNYDDDDIYGPTYIESMVGRMLERGLSVLKLCAWYDFDVRSSRCGFVEPSSFDNLDLLQYPCETELDELELERLHTEVRRNSWDGFGFSIVHLREVALSHPYPDVSMAEDVAFMSGLRSALGSECVGLHSDTVGICLHVMHGGNTADSPAHRPVALDAMKGLAVCDLDFVSPLLQACEQRDGGGAPDRFYARSHSLGAIAKMRDSDAASIARHIGRTRMRVSSGAPLD